MWDRKHDHLHDAVGPSLSNSVPRPNVMPIFSQFFHQLILVWCQFDVAEVEGGRLVTVGHHVSGGKQACMNKKRFCILEKFFFSSYVLGSLIFLRFSSAFSSPIPTWQPKASRVLWTQQPRSSDRHMWIPGELVKNPNSSSELT